ncbi:hypothetical protein BATDEDRAFT_34868 [Batrachochytrium dendrobatidis JAM81]|uniref:Cap-specific mRNA (nucleoside-2'-O-)-methyltransferase 1 n=1 Tax=Batrachochytrium dendrobatidis (strain JAM81 / FGSC 10211) TaxID=684364 RepID=F4P0L5_BATDJ|nr:uncharacterized protein BATDEDRAFT_34868 [Batrachochytrium dendrobatidis JAM81]EGF81301.1 hypothetical protein BATDEDRAFT_34868 [Batrachochytrium dendrobatidis JAM81]|eukprot:XP_006678025.1 hypothetical protein BATDEDRAFT_34868 [Batrachochytrium dendrobatidis JAM81]
MSMESLVDVAQLLYDTEQYHQTKLVSDIPPPNIFELRAMVDRNHNSNYQRTTNSHQSTRYKSHPYAQKSSYAPSSSHSSLDSDSRQSHSSKLFRNDVKVRYETPVSWLIRGAKSRSANSWMNHADIIVQEAMPVDYNVLCYSDLVEQLLTAKKSLAELPKDALIKGRDAANPYELVGKSVFIDSSAVKLASLDAQFNFSNIDQKTQNDYGIEFADFCSEYGGFTEYLLWRKQLMRQPARGWGMTLRGEKDYMFKKMIVPPGAFPQLDFEAVYGIDGSGDICNSENIKAFADHVMKATNGRGVDLVLADGELDTMHDGMHLENHSHQRMLCQILSMFHILKQVTPLSGELLYILHLHFSKIAILKPLASRPADAERYIICENLELSFPSPLIAHLFECNSKFDLLKSSADRAYSSRQPEPDTENKAALGLQQVSDILNRDWVLSDETFVDYIQALNMKMAVKQREAILELLKYTGQPGVVTPLPFDQIQIRDQCLNAWKLPNLDAVEKPLASKREDESRSRSYSQSNHSYYDRDSRYQRQDRSRPYRSSNSQYGSGAQRENYDYQHY